MFEVLRLSMKADAIDLTNPEPTKKKPSKTELDEEAALKRLG